MPRGPGLAGARVQLRGGKLQGARKAVGGLLHGNKWSLVQALPLPQGLTFLQHRLLPAWGSWECSNRLCPHEGRKSRCSRYPCGPGTRDWKGFLWRSCCTGEGCMKLTGAKHGWCGSQDPSISEATFVCITFRHLGHLRLRGLAACHHTARW